MYFDECPSWRQAVDHLRVLASEFGFAVEYELVETPEDAVRQNFHGSPSIVVDGQDLFPTRTAQVGLSCRIYQTPDGAAGCPTLEQIRSALQARQQPSSL